jgi:hypothetical protein
MLGNSGRCSKHEEFYDSPLLLTLVRSVSARQHGAAENSDIFLQAQFRNYMDKACTFEMIFQQVSQSFRESL